MRTFIIVLDIIILICLIAFASIFYSKDEWYGMIIPSVTALFVLLNLLVILLRLDSKNSWLALHFQRKRLEEKKKIAALEIEKKIEAGKKEGKKQ